MAAARQGRRKTAPPRRRQPRSGRRSPARRRKPQEKRRRSPARRQPARPRDGEQPSSEAKMLRQLQRDSKLLSPKAKGLMFSFVNDIYRKVSTEAERLRRQSRRPTVGPSQVQAALRELMPKKRVRRAASPVPKRSR